jgi:hypothetical protein
VVEKKKSQSFGIPTACSWAAMQVSLNRPELHRNLHQLTGIEVVVI